MKQPPEHGTVNRYNYHKCRCAECRAANSRHTKECRKLRMERELPAHREHGVWTTYVNYGCRCDKCSEKARAVNRQAYLRHKEGGISTTQQGMGTDPRNEGGYLGVYDLGTYLSKGNE